jgi:hypothetical protein
MGGDHVTDLCASISKASPVWIDYVVDDFKKEAITTAGSLGFSKLLLKTLISSHGGDMKIMTPR